MIPATDTGHYFTGVMPEDISLYWDDLCRLIEKPLKKTDADKYYTPDDVLWKCVNKDWQCWISWHDKQIDCVFITFIQEYPTGYRSFVIYLVGGERINDWLSQAWSVFKDYAKANGCGEIVGMGREGWLRALKKVETNPIEPLLRFSVRL